MINVSAVNLSRGGHPLLENASVTLHSGWRVVVTGRNGSGKSSFFRLLLGDLQPEAGDAGIQSGLRVAWMDQDIPAADRCTLDWVLDGDSALRTAQNALRIAQAGGDGMAIALAHEQLDALGAWRAEARAARILQGLGFDPDALDQPVSSFSGGWRMRLNLARALLCPSDVLLLDEPTNHLDLDTVIWLEQWLKRYEGTLLLISHDRDFIDALATHILHLDQRKLELYTGNYSRFEQLRAEKLALQASAHASQQRRKKEIENFVRRFGAKATKARQARSRMRELERMEEIVLAHADSPFQFEIPVSARTSTPLLVLKSARLGYAAAPILQNVHLQLNPGDRIGLLGANGQGKSTLIRSLAGELALLEGERTAGAHLRIGYFSQHQVEVLRAEDSALAHLQRLAEREPELALRKFLGGFGFSGDHCLRPVSGFSGGERARLALALIAWQAPNLLLLDEPANHLDLEMRHALNMALQNFEGALILVSHDRHLMRSLPDSFLWVRDGVVEPFQGDLEEYEIALRNLNTASTETAGDPLDTVGSVVGNETVARTDDSRARRQQAAAARMALKPLRDQLARTESEIEKIISEIDSIDRWLADPETYSAAAPELISARVTAQGRLRKQLEEVESSWLMLSEELEDKSRH